MNKRRINGLIMAIIGILYMFSFFVLVDAFEKVNDTLCMIMTIISVLFILFGSVMVFFKTPKEQFMEEAIRKEENIKLKKYYKYKPIFTYVIIVINILIYFLINVMNGETEVLKYAISKENFEFYRLFTAVFTHANEGHIMFNMLALYLCGSKLESLIGNWRYISLYLIAGIGSSLLIALLSTTPCVGASGAIFGLLGCYLLISFKNKYIMKYTFRYDLLPTIIINLIITFAIPNLSIIAHVSGLIIGIMYCLFFCNKIRFE